MGFRGVLVPLHWLAPAQGLTALSSPAILLAQLLYLVNYQIGARFTRIERGVITFDFGKYKM